MEVIVLVLLYAIIGRIGWWLLDIHHRYDTGAPPYVETEPVWVIIDTTIKTTAMVLIGPIVFLIAVGFWIQYLKD